MVTEERLILNSISDTTGLGQPLAGLGEEIHILPSGARYAPRLIGWVLEAMLIAVPFSSVQRRPSTVLGTIIDELESLQRRTNYFFRPSEHAMRSAKSYIFGIYAKMGATFPRPSFVLDGEKGIIIKWTRNGHTVRLNCLASESDEDYIYFENGEYDVEDNVTVEILQNRLNWLIQHEREPAR